MSENSSDIVYVEVFDNPNANIGDVNNDKVINIADATYLQMYLAEYDVTIG